MSVPIGKPDGRVRLAPSLLAADFARLGEAARMAEAGGADWLQLDVMDGHFVPNLSFGPDVARCLRPVTSLPIDVHLMVEDPARFIEPFAKAGADDITIHLEACAQPRKALRQIKALGLPAGLAVKPKTPLAKALPYLEDIDLLLVMTVEPGFGGQAFLDSQLKKVREARKAIERSGRPIFLQVDGGITLETGPKAVEAGADVLVAGSAVFRRPDPATALKDLRAACERALPARI